MRYRAHLVVGPALAAIGLLAGAQGSGSDQETTNAAMVANDAEAIGRYMDDDWIIVDGDSGTIDRARIPAADESAELTHSELRNENARVRVYGDTAEATSKGTYRGQPFATHGRATSVNVKVKRDGRWLCIPDPPSADKPGKDASGEPVVVIR